MLTCSRWQSHHWCLAGIIHCAPCIIFLQHANMATLLIRTKHKGQQRPMGMSLVFWDNLKFWLNDSARGKVRGSTKSAGFFLMTQWMSMQNCMVIHRLVVEVFQVWTSYKVLVWLINTKLRKDLKWKQNSVLSVSKLDVYVKKKESKVGRQRLICAICLV